MTKPPAVLLALLLSLIVHPSFGATSVVQHPAPEDFENPAALKFVDAVGHGDVAGALAAAKAAPGGVNTVGKGGGTALWVAVNRGDKPMVGALLQAGADPNGAPDHAPLHAAVRNRDLDMIKLLLLGKAKPDATMGGETPLYEAGLIGSTEAGALLLAAKADIDHGDELGRTAMVTAASADHWRMVMFLLEHGASPWKDGNGMTVADFAVSSRILPNNKDGVVLPEVIEKLKAAGSPWPPPTVPEVRALKAAGKWPPAGAKAR